MMRGFAPIALVLMLVVGVHPPPSQEVLAAFSEPIIADHNSTDIAQIPPEYIEAARQNLQIWYGHTSHGSQITTGMEILRSQDDLYSYNNGPGSLSYAEPNAGDLGNPDWATLTRNQLDRPDNDRNVVIWSWCGQVSGASEADISNYLSLMSRLEADYPDVVFVYMTGHLDGTGPDANLYQRNDQIREYVEENNRVLFDFADIESWDPDGDYYPHESDECHWCQDWCDSHACPSCSSTCQHSHCFNCYQKGVAFWWLLARLAGWPGPDGEETTPRPIATPSATRAPSPTTPTPTVAPVPCGAVSVEAEPFEFEWEAPGLKIRVTNLSDDDIPYWSIEGLLPEGATVVTAYGGSCTQDERVLFCEQDEYSEGLSAGQTREVSPQFWGISVDELSLTDIEFNGEPVDCSPPPSPTPRRAP